MNPANITRRTGVCACIMAMILSATLHAAQESPEKLGTTGAYKPTWDSLADHPVPTWFRDAKFGIYTHWGPYSVPACGPNGSWYAHNMYRPNTKQGKYHLEHYGKPEKFGFKDIIPLFKAEKFDPDDWAELFKKAGAQFAGPVAEHHEGFSMWDSDITRWNAKDMGPRRDVVGELEKAIRKRDMKFMVAFHHAQNWWHYPTWNKNFDCSNPKYAGLYTTPHKRGAKPNKWFLDRWKGKLVEVVDKYDPDMIWFDFRLDAIRESYRQEFVAYYYNKAVERKKDVLITYKGHDLPPGTGVEDLELGRMAGMTHHVWLTDSSVDAQGAWSYVEGAPWKTPNRLIDNLVDRVSKNGQLLLNVGPKADGTIPRPARKLLLAMGAWLKVNGEAIYGTRPWIISGEGPTKLDKSGAFNEGNEPTYTPKDIRFTTRGDALYAVLLAWPGEKINIKTLRRLYESDIVSVTMLGAPGELKWSHDGKGLTVELPSKKPCRHAYALKIVLK